MSSKNLVRLKKADHGIQLLKNVIGLLHWDQETYMPEAGLEERSEQLAFLEGEVHERQTKSEVCELIWECEQQDDLNIVDSAFIRESRRIYDRETKLPKSLVTAIARQASLNHASWISAKEASDFSLFRNDLYETVRLTREKAEHLGFRNNRYDPHMDDREIRQVRKEKCYITNEGGYHSYFGILSSSLFNDESFEVEDDASKSKIKNAFIKSLKNKKLNKKILGEFIDLVA